MLLIIIPAMVTGVYKIGADTTGVIFHDSTFNEKLLWTKVMS